MIIKKSIKFDCAHMLSSYVGKCSNLHGHTYHGFVQIEGEPIYTTWMIMDYNEIKEVVDKYDHAIIFSDSIIREDAEDILYDWAVKYDMRRVVLKRGKTTAETLTEVIASELADRLSKNGKFNITVNLSETDGSYAEYKLCM